MIILRNLLLVEIGKNKKKFLFMRKIFFFFFFFRKENRFDILIYECLFLGFLIGFISIYYYIPYILIFFLLIHITGTLYFEKFLNSRQKIDKKPIPKEYLYNYHLKPTNDLRLQQVNIIFFLFLNISCYSSLRHH